MSKQALILTTIILFFSANKVQADVINSKWVGGTEGEWWNSSNWNPEMIPTIDPSETRHFFVTIDSGTSKTTITLGTIAIFIEQLDCYGVINLLPGSLWCNNGVYNYGHLEIETLKLYNKLWNREAATLKVTGKVDGGDTFNTGVLIIEPKADFCATKHLGNGGRIEMQGGVCSTTGVVDSNGVIEGFGIVDSDQDFFNGGKIRATADSLVCRTGEHFWQVGILVNDPTASLQVIHTGQVSDVNNFGTIEVNSGGGVAFDCNMVNEPNAVIELLGGTLAAHSITQKADATLKGQGDIAGNLVIETEGLIQLTGPANIFGNLQIDQTATLEINDGTTLITDQVTCNGTIHMKGGWIIPQGGLSGDCNIIWEPGVYTNIADFNLDGMVNLQDFAIFTDTWLWQTDWR